MKRLTIRSGFTGETYLTGEADVCWANRPIEERAFCTGCHRHKGKDRTNCGALMLIDRLAAIEDILCDGTDEYDLDRLRELAEADREGRCVVLPRLEPGRGDPAGEPGEPGPPGVPWSPGRHKTYNELIKWLRTASGSPGGVKMSNAAADALAGLQAENDYMRKLLHQYCSCKVCANAADPYGLHCKFGGCNGGGNGAVEEDRWQLRPQT